MAATTKLYSLSDNPNFPCLLLKWPEICVMLDCALDLRPLLQFLPSSLVENSRLCKFPTYPLPLEARSNATELKELSNRQMAIDAAVEVLPPDCDSINLAEIDVILISNYKNMLALPYITEICDGFKGAIYLTDPTLQYGRLLMEELVQYVETGPKPKANQSWKSAGVLKHLHNLSAPHPSLWKSLYTLQQLQDCLAKCQTVAFKETLDLQALLKVTAVSSGYCVGGCNWILETDYEKIVYMSNSSTLTTHTKQMDVQALRDADVMILSNLSQSPLQHPDSMLDEFCRAVTNAIKTGGNVLAPCFALGLLYDLIECVVGHLDSVGLSQTPIYVLANSAENSLALANIYAEWLADSKQAKVFIPEEPFLHGFLAKNNRLKVYKSCYAGLSQDFRTPCVIFASHPSLRLGDSVHFMEIWSNDPRNVLILTEPEYVSPNILAPYQPMSMKALFCPIDTSLTYTQANLLLNDLKPKLLCLPECYVSSKKANASAADQAINQDLSINYSGSCAIIRKNSPLNIPFSTKFRKMHVDASLANSIELVKSIDFLSIGSISGDLSIFSNKLEIEQLEDNDVRNVQNLLPYGQLKVRRLIEELKKAGFDPVLDEKNDIPCIKLDKEKAYFEIKPNETHLICANNEENLRLKLRDILLNCLCKF